MGLSWVRQPALASIIDRSFGAWAHDQHVAQVVHQQVG